jgi:hypothetical protein
MIENRRRASASQGVSSHEPGTTATSQSQVDAATTAVTCSIGSSLASAIRSPAQSLNLIASLWTCATVRSQVGVRIRLGPLRRISISRRGNQEIDEIPNRVELAQAGADQVQFAA